MAEGVDPKPTESVAGQKANDEFADLLAHDLQAPLRQIATSLGLLQSRYTNDLRPEALELLAVAKSGCSAMQSMIRDLTLYARLARDPLQPQKLDLHSVLESVLGEFGSLRGHVRLEAQANHVVADAAGLRIVLRQLISNAEAAKSSRPLEILFKTRESGNEVEISISDNGVGFDPKHTERIFLPFVKLNPQSPGTGMGLTATRRVIERHGGRIWAATKQGVGTNLTFTLPILHPGEKYL